MMMKDFFQIQQRLSNAIVHGHFSEFESLITQYPELDVNAPINNSRETLLHIAANQWFPDFDTIKGIRKCITLLIKERGASILCLNISLSSPIGDSTRLSPTLTWHMLNCVQSLESDEIFSLLEELYTTEWSCSSFWIVNQLAARFFVETLSALQRFVGVCEDRAKHHRGHSVYFWEESVVHYCAVWSILYLLSFNDSESVEESRLTDSPQASPFIRDLISDLYLKRLIPNATVSGCSDTDLLIRRIAICRNELIDPVAQRREIRRDALALASGLQMMRLPLLQLITILDYMHPVYRLVDFGLKWRLLYAVKHYHQRA